MDIEEAVLKPKKPQPHPETGACRPAWISRGWMFYGNVDKANTRLKQYKAGVEAEWWKKKLLVTCNVVWLCGGTTADITPAQPLKFNMNDACEKIKKQHFKIRVKSQMVLMFDYMKLDVSLFDGGRMLIKNVSRQGNADESLPRNSQNNQHNHIKLKTQFCLIFA